MDILDCLTYDFDRLRDLTIDLSIATSPQAREMAFRDLVHLNEVTLKAQTTAINGVGQTLDRPSEPPLNEFTKRKLLDQGDGLSLRMSEIAASLRRNQRTEIRETKMELYSDLVLQRILDCERGVLPVLFDHLSDSQRAEMGALYMTYRSLALENGFDQPHAI